MEIQLTVQKNDIHKLGYTQYEVDGNLNIICKSDLANITEILLRNVLKCFGEEYRIVGEEDYYQKDDEEFLPSGFRFITNLPFKEITI